MLIVNRPSSLRSPGSAELRAASCGVPAGGGREAGPGVAATSPGNGFETAARSSSPRGDFGALKMQKCKSILVCAVAHFKTIF